MLQGMFASQDISALLGGIENLQQCHQMIFFQASYSFLGVSYFKKCVK